MSGRFITLEGIDGAGKSSHLDAISAHLRAMGREVVVTREPGGTPAAERMRDLVLAEDMSPRAETLLVFTARADHLERLIRPALARGCDVLCDRFTDATYAYQCGGRGVPVEWVRTLEHLIHPDLQPDLVLLFDAEASVARARLGSRQGSGADRFERQDEGFFERVRAHYLERARAAPDRYEVLDASRPIDALRIDVLARVSRLAR
ncbi:MAG: dTMP kinase [Pseudomonadota bacterium]|jgi:dTMP kinase